MRNEANWRTNGPGYSGLRGGIEGGIGFGGLRAEAFQFFERAVVIALGGINAALDTGEGLDVGAVDVAEGEVWVEMTAFFVPVPVIAPDLGFGFAQAAEEPLAVNQSVDQGALLGRGSLKTVMVFGGERFERLGVFAADDLGGGVNAGLESVHAGNGFAFERARTGGFFRVEAVGLYLFDGRHGLVV